MNNLNAFSRTELLIGEDGLNKLKSASVAVFGVGGVGSYTVEALVRSGVGRLTLVDSDEITITNLNRQLPATLKTLGQLKVDACKEHIAEINPECKVTATALFYCTETAEKIDLSQFDYVVDAVDSVSSKLMLAQRCEQLGVPIISSMGAGNLLDPTKFEVADIYKTSVCPLAKAMRHELKRIGVSKLKVVYSKELPRKPIANEAEASASKRPTPASIAFVPSVVGLIIAGEVIKDICKINEA